MTAKRAWLLLANGFEETEAIGTWDALQRGGVEVFTVSIHETLDVEGAHGLLLSADTTLSAIQDELADAVVLPGGGAGAEHLKQSSAVARIVRSHHDAGRIIGAICAAPKVLGHLGLLQGRRATCYPGFEAELIGATTTTEAVVTDGTIITGRGPAYALHFGCALVAALNGTHQAHEVADGLLLHDMH